MLYAGVVIGLWLEIIRILRRLFAAGPVMGLALDGLFLLGVFGAVGVMLIRASHGDLRLYALLGAICGFLVYLCSASVLFRWVGRRGVCALTRLAAAVKRNKLFRIVFK